MSLLCILILLVYLGNAITMVVFNVPGIVSQTQRVRSSMTDDQGLTDDLFEVQMPPFKPFESGFQFAIGF